MTDRTNPRISVNKLGEYMVASPARRQRIVLDQKRPRDFIVARYREAIGPMVDFLVGGAKDDRILMRAISDLETKPVSTDFQVQDRDLSIEALESFLESADQLELHDLKVRAGGADSQRLLIGGVHVSVRPDIILSGQDRGTVGCVKLYLSKTCPLDETAAAHIGVVLTRLSEEHLMDGKVADHRLCSVFDVFGQEVFTAPRAVRRRQKEIEAACEEIALRWEAA